MPTREATAPVDADSPREAARDAGLRYASDTGPGLSRRRSGRGFSYRGPDGVAVRDPETLVARRSYVHPAVLEAYLDGAIGGALVEAAEEQASPPAEASPEEEAEVVGLLRQRLDADAARSRRRRSRRGPKA